MVQQDLPIGKKRTIPEKILDYLAEQASPKALHEIPFSAVGGNQPCVSARMRELRRAGFVGKVRNQGENYDRWFIIKNS